MAIENIRAEVLIKGRVQGVGFRAFALSKARELGVVGWIANLGTSEVKAVAEGSTQPIEDFLHLLHQGPTSARVETVEVSFENSATGEFESFDIAPTVSAP